MINLIKKIFVQKSKMPSDYDGVSDFFINAPESLKKEILRKAAIEANKDQRKLYNLANRNNITVK